MEIVEKLISEANVLKGQVGWLLYDLKLGWEVKKEKEQNIESDFYC